MCRLPHVEWRCKHTQNIWEYCRDATAPSRTPSSAEQTNTPCETFISKHGPAPPKGPTDDEYRNFCCKFVCCLEDQADTYKEVLDLEAALGITEKDSLPRVPSLFLSRQQKSLKVVRKRFQALVKRHEERCEALYYGLGVVEESDAYRAPAEGLTVVKKRSGEASERKLEDQTRDAKAADESLPPSDEKSTQAHQSGAQHTKSQGPALEGGEAQEVVTSRVHTS